MLIAMAGLPGTGKSAIAARLAEKIGAVVLCKDVVRAAMFPAVDYSREQDDCAMDAIYARARRILGAARLPVILDGRTFSKPYQVRDLLAAAEGMHEAPRMIECICSDYVARERIERDFVRGNHPAGNRTFDLYLKVKAGAEPLAVPRLVLDTGVQSLEECLNLAMEHLEHTQKFG